MAPFREERSLFLTQISGFCDGRNGITVLGV